MAVVVATVNAADPAVASSQIIAPVITGVSIALPVTSPGTLSK